MQFFTRLFKGLLFSLFFIPHFLYGQADTSFWFVAPEISIGNSNQLDRPIYLRLSSFSLPGTVTVSQPADAGFAPIVINIPANSSATIDLTPVIDSVENKPANRVNNFGLHIQATSNITAYYEVEGGLSCGVCNPELYSLKGRNALGTSFWTPFQQTYDNSNSYSPLPYSSFNIVATEDNTTVTVVPTRNIVGHVAGVSFNVMLNRGQTFACEATSETASEHPSGSTVVSDKPVAVTVSDDLIDINGTGQDVEGDQLIPVDKTGTDYIVIGAPSTNNDIAVIVATQNNTQINVDGVLTTTINADSSYQYVLNGAAATYISTSAPAYVFQLTTDNNEAGGAVIPPINCTGSSVVSVTHSYSAPFNVFLVTQNGNQGNFLFNGAPGVILASSFQPVPGIANWEYARIDLTSQGVVGADTRISNTSGLFDMGVLQGVSNGASYGYFSDFAVHNSVTVKNICTASSVSLIASVSSANHVWNTTDTTDSITVSQSGTYWVQNISSGCTNTDTFHVNISGALPVVTAGNDTTVCGNSKVQLMAKGTGNVYRWTPTTGLNDSTIANPVAKPGITTTYIVANSNVCGTALDSVVIQVIPQPVISYLTPNSTICKGNNIQLVVSSNPNYSWSPYVGLSCSGCQLPFASPAVTTTYYVTLNNNGCKASDSVIITVVPHPPFVVTGDTTICVGHSAQLNASPEDSYSWIPSTGLSDTSIANPVATPSFTTTYYLTANGICGMQNGSVIVTIEQKPFVVVSSDTSICAGGAVQLHVLGGLSYQWFPADGLNNSTSANPVATPQNSTTYTVVAYNLSDCFSDGNTVVNLLQYPQIDMPATQQVICGQGVELEPTVNATVFHWIAAAGLMDTTLLNPIVNPAQTTTYTFIASNGGCTTSATTVVQVLKGYAALPNAFSPNHDGHNDIYRILYSCGFNLDYFKIYDRWGELVFETEQINAGWDGLYKGVEAQVGVYVYVVSGHKDTGEKVFMKGNVTLLR